MLTCEQHSGLQVILLGISEPGLDHSNKGQIPETLALAEMLMFNTVHEYIVTLNSTGSFVFISKAMD